MFQIQTDQPTRLQYLVQVKPLFGEFMPTTSAIIDEPGIGKAVRVWCEGEAIRPNPMAVFKLTDTIN